MHTPSTWLALMIGNSHLHWAQFAGSMLQQVWDTPYEHSEPPQDHSVAQALAYPLWLASVVPEQTRFWQQLHPRVHLLSLNDIPLQGLYSTLGIDRALALWGAAQTVGLPALVIDAGTGFTFTAATEQGHLLGGAILPGLGLQLRSLHGHTAALPAVQATLVWPDRWAVDTPAAMCSGVLHGLLASVRDFGEAWLKDYPDGRIVLTGGDRQILWSGLQQCFPDLATQITVDPHLIFWGIRAIVSRELAKKSPTEEG